MTPLHVMTPVPAGIDPPMGELHDKGTPDGFRRSIEAFWGHVPEQPPEGCWPWVGAANAAGYGRWASPYWPGETYAHRHAYRMAHGEIPDGHEIDHTCFVRGCVNPAHLRAITLAENRQHHAPRSV